MKYTFFGDEEHQKTILPLLKNHEYNEDNPDFVFSLGGDGTILRAVQAYANTNATFIGINMGKLGFYTDFELSEFSDILNQIENNSYQEVAFSLLEYHLMGAHATIRGIGLNELAIISPVHTHIIEVDIDGNHFESFRGTGFLISTPTGSTAYNKSCGGSIIDPKIEALQLTEVASINNRIYKTLASPIVFSPETLVQLRSDFTNTFLSVDGIELKAHDIEQIDVKLASKKVKFITRPHYDFWKRVKKSFLN
ncbi:MAG: NAD kinase [Bacilli bacterium]